MVSSGLIKEARRRAGLTQAELAARVGTAQSAIARWEAGRSRPSLETLVELVRACGLDLTWSLTAGDDHDVALIRRCLARRPEERLSDMVRAVRRLRAMAADG